MKKTYVSPTLTTFGSVSEITLHHKPDHNPPGNANGLSCGNGNVSGPSDCGIGNNGNPNGHDDNSHHS